jgi:hypothetical protein
VPVSGLAIMPRQQVFLITSLDPRVGPAAFLGVELGDAPVVRNAGGRSLRRSSTTSCSSATSAQTMIPDGPLLEVAVGCRPHCATSATPPARRGAAVQAMTNAWQGHWHPLYLLILAGYAVAAARLFRWE